MNFLVWLQTSAIGEAVRTSLWVYPWVNAFHSVGMGFLVGVLSMISLRVLGFGSFSLAPFKKFLVVVQVAIAVNVLTGVMLFAGDAQGFFSSPTFRIKALFIVLAGTTAWVLVRRVFREGVSWSQTGDAPQAVKVIAAASLVCWTGAIFAGRMTAYLP